MAVAAPSVATKVHGKVTATNSKCETRVLNEGDPVYPGEVVKTADGASVVIASVAAGTSKELPIQGKQTVTLDHEVLPATSHDATSSALLTSGAEITSIVNAIQSGQSLDNIQATASG